MSLLTEAPAGRHLAQLHRDADALGESVFEFLEAGLRRGDSVLITATRGRSDEIFELFEMLRAQF